MTNPTDRLNAALAGRYRIERELGEGGMANVYLADDLKHDRKVALKVLKPELAAVVGADRFLAEIKTTAHLQHPHILPLFDSGKADSFLFYVMPYVDGETLRDKLDREHQLAVDDAVRLTTNVAEALEYAHAQGVIHRDIKPANILLQSGKPVISDFGIALAVGTAGGGRLTETGLSVGTPHYMSPEQATGDLGVGAASDTYALGCVLYEMLVGEPPYTGGTAQAILGKIIAGEAANATKHRASVPPHVDAAIRKALEKVPADRFAGVRDFARALADPGFRHGGHAVTGGGADAGPWKRRTMAAWGAAAVLAVALGWTVLGSMNAPPPEVSRFVVPFEPGQGFVQGIQGVEFDLAPDGRSFVYVGPGDVGGVQLWHRTLQELEPRPVPGTQNGLDPSMSPDGSSVVFSVAGGLSVASLIGGPSLQVAEGVGGGGEWGSDGWIYFQQNLGISRVRGTGGEIEVVVQPPEVGGYRYPTALPGGEALIATYRRGRSAGSRIVGFSFETGEETELLAGAMARYATSGHLVYATPEGDLMAVAFDPDRVELLGAPVPLIQDVEVKSGSASMFTLADNGTLLYRSGSPTGGLYNLVWVDRDGTVERVDPSWTFDGSSPGSLGANEVGVEISPDGGRAALKIYTDAGEDIWVKELQVPGPPTRLTFEPGPDRRPRWSNDGEWITFHSDRGGNRDVWRKRSDGTGAAEVLLDLERPIIEVQFSPDDEWSIFRLGGVATVVGGRDIVGLRRGETAIVPVAAEAHDEKAAALSPDGRWLAYESTETGRDEIFVIPFPPVEGSKWQVSLEGGLSPRWAHDGDELFFVSSGDRDMTAVQISVEAGSFRVEARIPLFDVDERSLNVGSNWATYDVAADGRFLMHQFDVDEAVPVRMVLVQNWFEELKARVGGN